MHISQLCRDAHRIAVEKGWWPEGQNKDKRNKLELLALVHSEISEAVEELRKGYAPIYNIGIKPEGVLIELADAVIRIADMCEAFGWDLEAAVKMKMEVNKNRSQRHGGKLY